MKSTLSFVYILSVYALSLMSSCKDKDQPEPITEVPLEMPPFTDTGANVFAFKVDGEVVVAHDYISNTNGVVGSFYSDAFLYSGKYRKEGEVKSISFRVYPLKFVGVYELNEQPYGKVIYEVGTREPTQNIYVTNTDHKGKLTVTKLDTVNKIIAGHFEFQAQEFYWGDTLSVTEGQFDIKYAP